MLKEKSFFFGKNKFHKLRKKKGKALNIFQRGHIKNKRGKKKKRKKGYPP